MNLSIDLLSDYESLFNTIIKDVLRHKKDVLCIETNDENTNKRNYCSSPLLLNETNFEDYLDSDSGDLYLKNIHNKLIKLTPLLNLDDNRMLLDDEDKEDNKNIIEVQKSSINQNKKLINGLKGILITIIVFIIMYYVYILFVNVSIYSSNETNDNKFIRQYSLRSLYCNNINIIIFLIYLIVLIDKISKTEINKLNKEKNKLNIITDDHIDKIRTILTNLKTDLDKKFNDSSNDSSTDDTPTSSEISDKLYSFYQKYNDAKNNTNNNKLMKEQKIKDINHVFDDFKHIIYKQENNFKDVIVDNSNNIYCLMNMILYKDKCNNEIESIKCSLNNKCGIKGLVEVNHNSSFKNNLDIIDDNEIDIFFNKIKKEAFNKNTKYEINNLNIFKVIKNIFISKIYLNEIEKDEFIKFIYDHFDKINLKDEKIEINKFDIILNYKSLINIIYNDYEIYKKTENKDKPKTVGNIISKSRFNTILKYYTTDQLKELNTKIIDTVYKIDNFKSSFKDEIYEDIESRRNSNNYIKDLSYTIIAISVVDFACYFMEESSKLYNSNKKESDGNTQEAGSNDEKRTLTVLKIIRRTSLIILVNMIIFSYWYKIESFINVQELIMKNNNNIFSKNLLDLQEKMNNIVIIKDINDYENNQSKINKILDLYSIKGKMNNNKAIFSKYNSGNDYTILDEDDITNIVIEDLYNSLKEVMRLYECCSFLNKNPKLPLFPWTEFTINIIFAIIVGVVAIQLFISFNPMDLIEKIKENIDNKITEKINNMEGGNGRFGSVITSGVNTEKKKITAQREINEKEMKLRELGYDKKNIKKFEKRRNKTNNDKENLIDNIDSIIKKNNSLHDNIISINDQINDLNTQLTEVTSSSSNDSMNNKSTIINQRINELNNQKDELFKTEISNIKKHKKICSEILKNEDLIKILKKNNSYTIINKIINTIENITIDNLQKIENENLVNILNQDFDTKFDEHFITVLEKEYFIKNDDLKEIDDLLKDISDKKIAFSPENYELNAKYLLNTVIISLALYYSYNIYWHTIDFNDNLYRI